MERIICRETTIGDIPEEDFLVIKQTEEESANLDKIGHRKYGMKQITTNKGNVYFYDYTVLKHAGLFINNGTMIKIGTLHSTKGPAYYCQLSKSIAKLWYVNGKLIDYEEIKEWYSEQNWGLDTPLSPDLEVLFRLRFL